MNDAASNAAQGSKGVLAEARSLLSLAGPLIGNNIAIAGMNFADTVMAGRLGKYDLGAVAVGSSVWMLAFLFAMGTLMAISPIVSQRFGGGHLPEIGRYTRQGLWLSQALGWLVLAVLFTATPPALTAIGIEPDIRPLTAGYVQAIAWGAPAICAYLALRFTSEGVGWTRPIMYCTLASLVVNVAGNYVFMYGKLGAPAMGAVGCGVASAIAMWFLLAAFLGYVLLSPRYRPFALFERFTWPRRRELGEILALGIPISATVSAEIGLFTAVSLLMGTLSASIAAAHQVAINYAATMFMVPLAINSATTVRVGQALGAGRPELARHRGFVGIGMCGLFMATSAVVMLLLREEIVRLYTPDPEVSAVAVGLLLVAAVFQVSDGVQVGAAGALRGYKDTRVPMLLNLLAYWVIAFPLAWAAAVKLELGPQLIWGGFVVGLSLAAVLLVWRFLRVSARAAGTENFEPPAI